PFFILGRDTKMAELFLIFSTRKLGGSYSVGGTAGIDIGSRRVHRTFTISHARLLLIGHRFVRIQTDDWPLFSDAVTRRSGSQPPMETFDCDRNLRPKPASHPQTSKHPALPRSRAQQLAPRHLEQAFSAYRCPVRHRPRERTFEHERSNGLQNV